MNMNMCEMRVLPVIVASSFLFGGCATTVTKNCAVESVPSGAAVFVNGQKVGETPCSITLHDIPEHPDNYTIIARLPGYETATREIEDIREPIGTPLGSTLPERIVFNLKPLAQAAPVTTGDFSSTAVPSFAGAAFEDLLVARELSAAMAKGRNNALLAAKTTTLPNLLREKKTKELTTLVIRIEQLILDLNRESEAAKDRAQQAVEGGARAAREPRELSLLYKERIEILKPILAAIREEIANRSR
jgi:hypothetical protein